MLLGLRQKQEGENSQRGIQCERLQVGEGTPQGFLQVQNQSTLLRNTERSLGRFSWLFVSKESRLEGIGPGWGCCSYLCEKEVTLSQATRAMGDWRSNLQTLVEPKPTPDGQTRRRFTLKMMRSTRCCSFVLRINKEPTQIQVLITLRHYICVIKTITTDPGDVYSCLLGKLFLFYHFRCTDSLITFACWQQAGKQMFWEAFEWLSHFRKWPKYFSTNSARAGVLFHAVGHFWALKKNTWVNHTALQCWQATCHCSYDSNSWQMGSLENSLQMAQTKWRVQDRLKTKEVNTKSFN